jgi:hypothetical protein
MVVALMRDEGAASGTVTIATLVDGALRKVRVALAPKPTCSPSVLTRRSAA